MRWVVDDFEHVVIHTLMDVPAHLSAIVPTGAYRHLATLMAQFGSTAVRVRDPHTGDIKSRGAATFGTPRAHEDRRMLPYNAQDDLTVARGTSMFEYANASFNS